MPDDRLVHPRCGRSQKVSLLTDLEFRVWIQYMLSADDFGVMPMSTATLKADNHHLENRPAKVLQRCMESLVTSGLCRKFEHQGRWYLCQHDWQDWQKVTWPSRTNYPPPPADVLETFTPWTQLLFSVHPGARKAPKKPEGSSPNVLQSYQEELSPSRAGAPAERLTANANGLGERQTADAARPLPIVQPRRRDAAYEFGGGIYVPQRAHADLLGLHPPGFEPELAAWYASVAAAWQGRNTGADMIRFWKARHDETWPPERPEIAKRGVPSWAV